MPTRNDGWTRARHLDLRRFRLSLIPPVTLGQVAEGSRVDKSLLSRLERGRRPITTGCARRLARFYSAWTGRRVTAGQILDMSDRGLARFQRRAAPRRGAFGLAGALLALWSARGAAEPGLGIHPSVTLPTCIRVETNAPAIDPLRYKSGALVDLPLVLSFSTEPCPGQAMPPAAPACLLVDGSIGQTDNVYTTGAPADVYLRLRIWTVPCPPAEVAPAPGPVARPGDR